VQTGDPSLDRSRHQAEHADGDGNDQKFVDKNKNQLP